jgi:hypothetical protein
MRPPPIPDGQGRQPIYFYSIADQVLHAAFTCFHLVEEVLVVVVVVVDGDGGVCVQST